MVSGRSVTECWRLRPVNQSDIAGLHALACQPLIYRYLFDNVATRMAWTAITRAFASPHIDYIVAGHDLPNTASSAVMRRLGMRFHKNVRYPLGAGAEYILHRDDAGPMPRPALIPLP